MTLIAIIAPVSLAAVAAAAIIAAITVRVAATVVVIIVATAVTAGERWWRINLHSVRHRSDFKIQV